MSRLLILLIGVVIVVHGRPRHHKHRKAHASSQVNDEPQPQAYQQPTSDQDATGPLENVNVYNMRVHKVATNSKASAQMNAHSVSLSMQGPGMIELNTNELQVAPGKAKPDHTIHVIKDTPTSQSVDVVNVHSGHELPVTLPLNEPPAPKVEQKPKDLEPAFEPKEPENEHTKPHPKLATQHQGHAQNDKEASHEPFVHLQQKINKEIANKVLTKLESTLPVITDKPKHEKQVTNGHKIKLSTEDKPQRVFGNVDANNVAITMQGPGTASVTSQLSNGSHTIVFDPMWVGPCPDKNCPHQKGRKRHKN